MTWKKGQSGNPAGPAFLAPDLREVKKLTKREAIESLTRCVRMTPDRMKEHMMDPNISMLELAVCRLLVKAAEHGDDRRINFLLDRIIGKVTDKVEHSLPKPTVVKMFGEDAVTVIGRVKDEEE